MPQYHIGIIPDGNRRWARARGLSDQEGHEHGATILKNAIEWAVNKPEIKEISVYVLSEENFKRTKEELAWLNDVYIEGLQDLRQRKIIREQGITINMISTQPQKLTPELLQLFADMHGETKQYGNKLLNILIGYTGKREILRAAAHPLNRIKNLFFDLNEKDIERGLLVKTPCDFIIRSSFEEAERESKSGFLIWQSAYSEYYHINKHWGDVEMLDLEEAWAKFLHTRRMKGT